MALKSPVCESIGAVSHLGRVVTGSSHVGSKPNWVGLSDGERPGKLLCLSAFRAIRPVEGERSSKSACKLQPVGDWSESNVSWKPQKYLSSLPRPLSAFDPSTPGNGSRVRISFKGTLGSYSEDAALKAYPNCETVPCSEFEDAFKAVELWLADRAALPIESSSCGSIHQNYDLLLRHRLHIVGEVQLPVNLCLLALPGVRVEQLRCVLSHPLALALSDIALTKLNVARESVDDTAGAAQLVALEKLRDTGVIASARAAEVYGLNILAERIQDDLDIITRFLVLARDPIIPRTNKPFKTSIVFTLNGGPGALFKALAVFIVRNINLTKMESRPQRKRPLRVDDSNSGSAKYFDYLFYIDFEASMAESRAQNALGHLQEFTTFLRVLGCYPMDKIL